MRQGKLVICRRSILMATSRKDAKDVRGAHSHCLPPEDATVASPEEYEQLKMDVERLKQYGRMFTYIYISLLVRCGYAKALREGKQVHAHMTQWGCDRNIFCTNHLMRMYNYCGSLQDARRLFDAMPRKNEFSWNTMITAYTQNGHLKEAKSMFDIMPAPNAVSRNSLIIAYTQHGDLEDARRMFEQMPDRTVISWNAMITGYAQNGHSREAMLLFRRMEVEGVEPNHITFLGILDACEGVEALATGKVIHSRILGTGYESHIMVGTSLVNMYGKCGSLKNARSMFDTMPERNRVTWNAMLAAYAQNGHSKEALEFFKLMKREGVKANRVTYLSLVEACAHLSALEEGEEIHASIVKSGLQSNAKLGTALINMYGKCGRVESARQVFEDLPHSDVITWTAMITAYARGGHGNEAIGLLPLMDHEGVQTDKVTFISILDACANITDLKLGKILHSTIADEGLELDVSLATSLVYMYGKCGSLENARSVFDNMVQRNVISWNAIITVYAQNGESQATLELFQLMEVEGEQPNEYTCTSLLAACSHAGLMDDAWYYFVSMTENYGVELTIDHYACMVDLLGRLGKLDQAEDLICNMPFEPDVVLWTSLLGACKLHHSVDRGLRISEHVFEMIPGTSCAYVMLSNVYASAGKRDIAAKLRKAMQISGVKKHEGRSVLK